MELKFDHISSENGLPQNTVNTIAKDKFGFMWFGTEAGLCRYDGYRFTVYRYKAGDQKSINNNKIHSIVSDDQHNIWIQTFDTYTYCRYNYDTDDFTRVLKTSVSAAFQKRMLTGSANHGPTAQIYKNYQWHLDRKSNALIQTYLPTGTSIKYMANPVSRWSLNEPYVSKIYIDNHKILWVGTYSNGINKADLNAKPFHYYYHDSNNKNSIADNSIGALAEDQQGNIWVGSRYKGITVIRRHLPALHLNAEQTGENTLTNNKIRAIFCDSRGYIWVGTKKGLDGLRPGAQHIDHYRRAGLQDSAVYAIAENKAGDVWFATWRGIYKYASRSHAFLRIDSTLLGTYRLKTLLVDEHQNIWIGTEGQGVGILKETRENKLSLLYKFKHDDKNPNTISDDRITSIFRANDAKIWIGTSDGLNLYDPATRSFKHFFAAQNGLSDNTIAAITEDDNGYVWVSHKRGISQINKRTFAIRNYSLIDGLQSNEFSDGAVFKSRHSKMLYFGGSNGYNAFYPDSIKPEPTLPQVVLTELQILNKPVRINQEINGRVLLHKPFYLNDFIELNYQDKSIAIEFAGLHYANPAANKYAYMLEGFDKDWVYTDASRRIATYSNLSPGHYTFKVRAANSDGIWNPTPKTLQILVKPAIWASIWAYLLYTIFILALLSAFYFYSIRFARLKSKLNYEALIHEKENELHENKITFFTNISHEIKTPLSLILAPIERLMSMTQNNRPLNNELATIQSSGNRLLRLVSQLLDIRRLETGNAILKVSNSDLGQLVEKVSESFRTLAVQKGVGLQVETALSQDLWNLDPEKTEHILYNILSNAFKFTPKSGGEIKIKVSQIIDEGKKWAVITIIDNGIGIPTDELERIFKPFQQVPTNISGGTGLGLAYARSLAELHGGTIIAQSSIVKGENRTAFTIKLPDAVISVIPGKSLDQPVTEGLPEMESAQVYQQELGPEVGLMIDGRSPVLLIVEDNDEMRVYLNSCFADHYSILEACNGLEGLDMAIQHGPDIVVSDVSMPEMDGLALSKRLKEDILTSHIPVILLTAKEPVEYQIAGIETGADDYITKPFNLKLLALKMRNLLNIRLQLRDKYRGKISLIPNNILPASPDEKLLRKLQDFVTERIADPDLNGDEVGEKLGLSRTQLYRKMKALTGYSVTEFIKEIRLINAEKILLGKKFNINEVTYMVGFTDPDHFRKSFKAKFGVPPSAYVKSSDVAPKR